MINFDKKQALLSNWISIEVQENPDRYFLVHDMDIELTVLSARISGYGKDRYIVFRCSYKVLWDTASEKVYYKTQPEIFELWICLSGTHAVQGRKVLSKINSAIGLGELNDTKLYKDCKFKVHISNRSINNFHFNEIGRVYG
jgi:hypothetical protein